MRTFNEIRLFEICTVRWRLLSRREGRWVISAFRGTAKNEDFMRSVTGEPIQRYTDGGPGTAEFSKALGLVVLIACTKIQSDRINGSR